MSILMQRTPKEIEYELPIAYQRVGSEKYYWHTPYFLEKWIYICFKLLNPFHTTGLFRYSLKTSENQRFSVFREV